MPRMDVKANEGEVLVTAEEVRKCLTDPDDPPPSDDKEADPLHQSTGDEVV